MSEHQPLWPMILSGVFALLGVLAAGLLTHLADSRSHARMRKAARHSIIQELYADVLGNYEKTIRYTENGADYAELSHDLSRANARMLLLAPKEINEQAEKVGDLLLDWSSAYRQGQPKRLGETGFAVVSSRDAPQRSRAAELFPSLNDGIIALSAQMRAHLTEIEI